MLFLRRVGDIQCENKNKKKKNKKGSNIFSEKFDVGDVVMKRTHRKSKLGEKWEGPYEVIEFDAKKKGYKLKEKESNFVLEGYFPIDFLMLLRDFVDREDDNEDFEIEKVIGHRGNTENREYLVKWKGFVDVC